MYIHKKGQRSQHSDAGRQHVTSPSAPSSGQHSQSSSSSRLSETAARWRYFTAKQQMPERERANRTSKEVTRIKLEVLLGGNPWLAQFIDEAVNASAAQRQRLKDWQALLAERGERDPYLNRLVEAGFPSCDLFIVEGASTHSNPFTGYIQVQETDSMSIALAGIVQELHNISSVGLIAALEMAAMGIGLEGKPISKEQYVVAAERIEYFGVIKQLQALGLPAALAKFSALGEGPLREILVDPTGKYPNHSKAYADNVAAFWQFVDQTIQGQAGSKYAALGDLAKDLVRADASPENFDQALFEQYFAKLGGSHKDNHGARYDALQQYARQLGLI